MNMKIIYPDISSCKVIESVKKRPALYDKSDNRYFSSKKQKTNLWIEVSREVCSNWEQISQDERIELRHAIKRRWENIRTCFARELALQKKYNQESGEGELIRKRKKYEYFDLLTFLLNPEEANEIEVAIETDEESSDPLETMKIEYDNAESSKAEVEFINDSGTDYDDAQSSRVEIHNESADPPLRQFYERSENIDEKILETLKEMKKDEFDDDRQFLLSLVSSFKKLNDMQKFEARIGILKVLQEVTFQSKKT